MRNLSGGRQPGVTSAWGRPRSDRRRCRLRESTAGARALDGTSGRLLVSKALLSPELSQAHLEEYAERRTVRKRLADLGTKLEVWTNEGCVVQDPAERAARNEFIESDEVLTALQSCFMTGFDTLPQDLTHAELSDRLAAYR